MYRRMFFNLVFSLAAIALLAASPARGATITGVVNDSLLNKPIEYANIVLGRQADKVQVTGTTSKADGSFVLENVQPGEYVLIGNFIGYYGKTIEHVVVETNGSTVNVGTIGLVQSVIELQGVETTAERAAIEYQIDKKVINVSKQYTAASGSAIDVLENVPSVTVDIEGNVALRGSGNFRLLIDGRPTLVDNNDALRQIPASSIESIEIITNPSAKYDPDGTSGILNVITKKNSMNGINGLANANIGVNKKYGGDVLLNFRTSAFNFYVGGNYASRFFPGTSRQLSRTLHNDTLSVINSTGDAERQFDGQGLRTGIDLNLSEKDLLGIGLRLSSRAFSNNNRQDYTESHEPGGEQHRYISLSDFERGGDEWSAVLNYRRQFDKKGHELLAEIDYEQESSDETNNDDLLTPAGELQSGRRSVEKGPEYDLRAKIDYTLPVRQKDRFEAGYQSRVSGSREDNEVYEYSPVTGNYDFLDEFSHTTDYVLNIHSLYTLYALQLGPFGLQGGLRGEYTYRTVELVDENDKATIDRWDYFPTAHASLQLAKNQQAMASYTRRIDRPRGFFLEPFLTWMDAYNVRTGNPAIEPEYIDSYEASLQRNFGRNLVSLEGYYRVTHNKIERVQSVYADDVILHSVDNVGEDFTTGAELMINVDLSKKWNVNLMGNLYDYRIEGTLYNQPFTRVSRNWDVRFNNTLNLTKSLRVQVNTSYNSPSVSAQGERKGFFVTNLAVRQAFFGDKLELVAQARDVLSTAKFEFISSGENFYREGRFTREAPEYTLTINYLINNYKRQRPEGGGDGQGGGGMDMGDME